MKNLYSSYFISAFLFLIIGHPQANETHTLHQFLLFEFNSHDHSSQLISHFQKILLGLNYREIKVVKDNARKNSKIRSTPFPVFANIAPYKPTSIPTRSILFMQSSIHDVFHERRFDIITTAYQLQQKRIAITALPNIHVWRDSKGNIWTINHRRLASIILAGNIDKIPVTWISQKTLDKNRFEFTTKVKGKSIDAFLTKNLIMTISH
ncbi:hypothetical protein [uncultured Shewanella sp.]|uniref:hypothetical protein n=1 Tax=uncultured Shewanella sp. TaxID=173975 RepID=UPI0026354D17|nr:hypothetical protein [uncultured Shewanella sp.]